MVHPRGAPLEAGFLSLLCAVLGAEGLVRDARASVEPVRESAVGQIREEFLDTSQFPEVPSKPDSPPEPNEFFSSVPVYGYRRMHVKSTKRLDWMVMFPGNWSQGHLGNFCSNLPDGARCKYVGHPDSAEAAGLPMVSIAAFEHELRDTIDKFRDARYIEVDKMMKALPYKLEAEFNKTEFYKVPWGLDRIDDRVGLDGQYSAGRGGGGSHIYSIDSGIDTANREFGGRAVPTLEVLGTGIRVCNPFDHTCASDVTGHGTHTAGTLISEDFGVAKLAQVHAIRVLDNTGSGAFSWFVAALDWVMAYGARPAIVTASLGGVGKLQTVRDAIDGAAKAGITVVVAAGNENADACQFTPSYIPSALTIGSVDWYDTRSSFSNYGACIDVFAPGSHITSLGRTPGTLTTMSGTSMAAPHVAGIVALLYGRYMSIKNNDIKGAVALSSTNGVLKDLNQQGTPNKMAYTGPGSLTAPPGSPTQALPRRMPVPTPADPAKPSMAWNIGRLLMPNAGQMMPPMMPPPMMQPPMMPPPMMGPPMMGPPMMGPPMGMPMGPPMGPPPMAGPPMQWGYR